MSRKMCFSPSFIRSLLIGLIVFLSACNACHSKTENIENKNKSEIKYAVGFTLKRMKDYTLIEVRNPWDTTQVMDKYVLVARNKKLPAHLPSGTLVRIPLKRVALCSSVFAGEYDRLGALDKVVAVSEPKYMDIPAIKSGVACGKIADLGETTNLNVEKLLAAKTDILVISPFETSLQDKFKKNGIVIVKDASYMESSPLGRTEWLKFEAAFLGKDSLADAIFNKIEKRYLAIRKKVSCTKFRPTVLIDKKFGDAWYVPGGNSYMGNFIKDAGANYIWKNMKCEGSVPLTFETVFAKAVNAQFWLIKYYNQVNNLTYKQLGEEYELYKNFSAYKKREVFAVNTFKQPIYVDGTMEPDIVLSDMVNIFHPGLLPRYYPKYYHRIK